MDTVWYSWKRDGFLRIFQKESTLYENSNYKKWIVDPILLHTRECTKKSRNGYKRSRLAKSQRIGTQSSKTVFKNTVKKSRLNESTLSRISLFRMQAQDCSRGRIESIWSTWKSLMLQEGAYTMDQEFDGKGLTPYDPAHNSSFLLAGHIYM